VADVFLLQNAIEVNSKKAACRKKCVFHLKR